MRDLIQYAYLIGIETCVPFDAALLRPEERIREFCRVDRCGKYRRNYMCPPYVGTLEEIEARLQSYKNGLLLRFGRPMDVKNDAIQLRQSKLEFHEKVLQLEAKLLQSGVDRVWGMSGGDCSLCHACAARIDAPCPYPDKARTSLESIAVDVQGLLTCVGQDAGFRPDRITWTGCVLY